MVCRYNLQTTEKAKGLGDAYERYFQAAGDGYVAGMSAWIPGSVALSGALKFRKIKSGVLIGSRNFRIQYGKEFLSFYPGKFKGVKGITKGGLRTPHINFGKTHIFLNPFD